MFEEQGGACAICGTDEPGSKESWHLDHNHKTGSLRAILCGPCNRGLGLFKDDADTLLAAALYLMSGDS